MSEVLIIPNIMLRRGRKWNGGYNLIVRLGVTANKKERSCPRFLIVEFFGITPPAAATIGSKRRVSSVRRSRSPASPSTAKNGTASISAAARARISSTPARFDHGFDKNSAAELRKRLTPLIRKSQPYSKRIAHRGIWVEPKLLARSKIRAKSAEGKVPHPFFLGLREDTI